MEQIESFKDKNIVQPEKAKKEETPKVRKPGSKYYEPESHEEMDEYVQTVYGAKKASIKERIDKEAKEAEKNWPK